MEVKTRGQILDAFYIEKYDYFKDKDMEELYMHREEYILNVIKISDELKKNLDCVDILDLVIKAKITESKNKVIEGR